MHSLDLGSKDTVDIDGNAELLLQDVCQLQRQSVQGVGEIRAAYTALVILLDVTEGLAELLVLCHREQFG